VVISLTLRFGEGPMTGSNTTERKYIVLCGPQPFGFGLFHAFAKERV
jgi:hypothetical protein